MALGHTLVVCLPGSFVLATHGGSADAAAAAVAGAVQRGLASLPVGTALLTAPPGAAVTAGRSLHWLDQRPVAPGALLQLPS